MQPSLTRTEFEALAERYPVVPVAVEVLADRETAVPRQRLNIQLDFGNRGYLDAENGVLMVSLDPYLQVVKVNPPGAVNDGMVVWDVGNLPGNQNPPRNRQPLDPSGDVHTVPVNPRLVVNNIPHVDSDSDRDGGIATKLQLDRHPTLNGLNGALEATEGTIPIVLENRALELPDPVLQHLPHPVSKEFGSALIRPHEGSVALHVGEQDGGELTGHGRQSGRHWKGCRAGDPAVHQCSKSAALGLDQAVACVAAAGV